MKTMKSRGILFRVIALVVLFSMLTVSAVALSPSELNCSAAVAMDAYTGEVLFEKNPDTQLVPASLTKLMTVYLVYEAMEQGKFSLDSVVPIDSEVAMLSCNGTYSNVPLSMYSTYTVSQLLDAVIITSACAATLALAKMVAGTEADCVVLMNAAAEELGMNSVFYDSYGINASNRVTARGMGILCCQILQKYPDFLEHSRKLSYVHDGIRYYTTNHFLDGTYTCDGVVDGMKTGTMAVAGYCLTTTATQDGNRVVTVVLNSPYNDARYESAAKLLHYGFEQMSIRPPDYVEPFTDVSLNAWYADAVGYVYSQGLMKGINGWQFLPEDTLSRAMMAQILYNMSGNPQTPSDYLGDFTDVQTGAWYYDAMNWAVSTGLFQGRGGTRLDPDTGISRQEMVTLLFRYENYRGWDTSQRADISTYLDATDVMDFAQEAMSWSVAQGIVHGAGDDTLNPMGYAQRSQIAQVLMNSGYSVS